MAKKMVVVRLPDDLVNELRKRKRAGESIQSIVASALINYFMEGKKKAKKK